MPRRLDLTYDLNVAYIIGGVSVAKVSHLPAMPLCDKAGSVHQQELLRVYRAMSDPKAAKVTMPVFQCGPAKTLCETTLWGQYMSTWVGGMLYIGETGNGLWSRYNSKSMLRNLVLDERYGTVLEKGAKPIRAASKKVAAGEAGGEGAGAGEATPYAGRPPFVQTTDPFYIPGSELISMDPADYEERGVIHSFIGKVHPKQLAQYAPLVALAQLRSMRAFACRAGGKWCSAITVLAMVWLLPNIPIEQVQLDPSSGTAGQRGADGDADPWGAKPFSKDGGAVYETKTGLQPTDRCEWSFAGMSSVDKREGLQKALLFFCVDILEYVFCLGSMFRNVNPRFRRFLNAGLHMSATSFSAVILTMGTCLWSLWNVVLTVGPLMVRTDGC